MLIEEGKKYRKDIEAILSAEKLPVDDLPDKLDNFFVATENGTPIGVIGLEIYGSFGLLRSLAVLPESRSKGIAGKLIKKLDDLATALGLQELFMLTETAPEYFLRKGFHKIKREEMPEEVKQSPEFSYVCPASAVVMKKTYHTA